MLIAEKKNHKLASVSQEGEFLYVIPEKMLKSYTENWVKLHVL